MSKNPFKVGDKVRYLGSDPRIFYVYAIYSPTKVSLGLYAYPDTEQDYQVDIKEIVHYLPVHEVHKGEKKAEGWSVCNHYATDEDGLCVRCGYNTLHLTNKELKQRRKKRE